jgi:hypothetical protein
MIPPAPKKCGALLSGPDPDVEFVFNWVDSLAAAIVRLAQGGLDFILLELPIGDADPLRTMAVIRPRTILAELRPVV